ncbi:MAG TPA: glycine oxidase ThiO [Planctomycetaceae bacterium]|nr:glycine oxidase ThiO [Planctomycetaceae bacterium]
MTDVVIIGGGVIGLSAAFELAESGLSVRVLEQGTPGREASWAGAGMLPPGNPDVATGPEPLLRGHSHCRWPEWVARTTARSGIDPEYARCGSLEIPLDSDPSEFKNQIATWESEGVAVELLTRSQLHEHHYFLSDDITSAYRLPECGQVRNPRLLKSLMMACESLRAPIITGQPVIGFYWNGDRILAARTASEVYTADHFVIAGGAWSGGLLQQLGLDIPIKPIRGQIVLLEQRSLPFRCVLQSGSRYLVPRRDGRILVGATEEDVGFLKANTSGGVQGLLEFATRLVPSLRRAEFERCWSGLRPYREGGLPLIGRSPRARNVVIATGHFRAGLQLSPVTAVLVRQLVCGQPTLLPVEWFA